MYYDAGGISGPWINHYYNRVQYVGFNQDTVVQIQNIIYLLFIEFPYESNNQRIEIVHKPRGEIESS